VKVDEAGDQCFGRKVNHPIRLKRIIRAFGDIFDAPVFDQDNRWASWTSGRVGNQIADNDCLRRCQ
jgi:hypothetical protein